MKKWLATSVVFLVGHFVLVATWWKIYLGCSLVLVLYSYSRKLCFSSSLVIVPW